MPAACPRPPAAYARGTQGTRTASCTSIAKARQRMGTWREPKGTARRAGRGTRARGGGGSVHTVQGSPKTSVLVGSMLCGARGQVYELPRGRDDAAAQPRRSGTRHHRCTARQSHQLLPAPKTAAKQRRAAAPNRSSTLLHARPVAHARAKSGPAQPPAQAATASQHAGVATQHESPARTRGPPFWRGAV